ncbi:restriction endonuclease subunit S [Methanobrevibacter sp.]
MKILRFNGFDEEWETKKLSEISLINPKTKNLPNEFIYIDLDSVEKGTLTKFNRISVTDAPSRAQRLLDVEDILFQTVRPYQMNNLYFNCTDDDYVASTGYAQIKSKINSKFLYHYLHHAKFVDAVLKRCTGTSYPAINANDLKKIKIRIPSDFDEQKLIGDFFDKIDVKIESLQKKHRYYQDFKKYLMQQIFAQKLRFDFDDEWKTMRLNEIVFYQEGPGVRNYQYTKEGIKLLNVGNFVKNVLELDNTDKYISEEEAYGKYNHFLVDEGDLLIACSGIKAEYFDEKIAFAEKKHLPLCMNTSTMRFKSLDGKLLDLKYLKYYFQTEAFKKQVFRVMTGSAQFNFGPTHLKYFIIPIPSINEQKQIYELFGLVDDKISMINEELVKVNEFKKSLLQQMFVFRMFLLISVRKSAASNTS